REREAAALAGLAAYQTARRGKGRRLAGVRYRQGRARLRAYSRPSEARAVIVVPSLINPPTILDLTPHQSLMRWLAEQGFNPFLLDWGSPGADARDMDLTQHVERLLIPLIRRFKRPPVLAGYCLGGTLAAGAAAATPVAGLAMVAAPWHFAGFGSRAKADIAALWMGSRALCDAMGVVPMEVLQSGFWRLDPRRTIAKYERFASIAPRSQAARDFVALEDWANAGAPLPFAAGRQLFDEFVAADLPGSGGWRIKGKTVDPRALDCPAIDFVSTSDRIVPAATASGIASRHDVAAGHVGMIVGGKARDQLWQPLADWISAIPGTK
ncbi:MAG: alpha/beta fold hydrolase, partial [Sphingomonas sp.]